MDIQHEFRGFVCNKQFTALSQYYYDCYFSSINKNKNLIEIAIKEFWEKKIKNLLPYNSYVIDFGIIGSLSKYGSIEITPSNNTNNNNNNNNNNNISTSYYLNSYQVVCIELNPFDQYTDGALFNWKLSKQIFENGPFTFRINEKKEAIHDKTWWKKSTLDYFSSKRI